MSFTITITKSPHDAEKWINKIALSILKIRTYETNQNIQTSGRFKSDL